MTIGKLIARPLTKGVSEIAQPLIHTGTEAAGKAVVQTVKQSSKVVSESSQKLLNKISAYFKRIPADSKVSNPIKINLEGNSAGFTMDKTLSGTSYMPVGGDAHWVPVAQTHQHMLQ